MITRVTVGLTQTQASASRENCKDSTLGFDDEDYQNNDDNDNNDDTESKDNDAIPVQVVLFNLEKMRGSKIYTEEAKLEKMVTIIVYPWSLQTTSCVQVDLYDSFLPASDWGLGDQEWITLFGWKYPDMVFVYKYTNTNIDTNANMNTNTKTQMNKEGDQGKGYSVCMKIPWPPLMVKLTVKIRV